MLFSKKINFALFLLLFFSLSAYAQPISDNQDVVSQFNSDVTLLDRVQLSPSGYIAAPDTSRGLSEPVNTTPRLLNLKYEPPTIRPIAMKKNPPKPDFPFWAKVGYGIPNQPYAELSYQSKTNKYGYFGAYGKWHSADNSALTYQKFNNLAIQLNGAYYVDTIATVQARAGFEQDGVNFYGYNHADTSLHYTLDNTAQAFNKVFANLAVFNTKSNENDFHYKGGIDFYTVSDKFKSQETGVTGEVSATKFFSKKHPFTLVIRDEYSGFVNNDTAKQNVNILSFAPSFTFIEGAFRGKAGANLQFSAGRFIPNPDIEFMYSFSDAAIIFGGWQGAVRRNNFESLRQINPFMLSKPSLKNSHYENRYLGVKGKVDVFNYELQAYNQPIQNMPMFINNIGGDDRRFTVAYDTINVWGGHIGFGYKPSKVFDVSLSGDYRSFNKTVYHLPNVDATLAAKYAFNEVLNLRFAVYTAIGSKAIDTQTKPLSLQTITLAPMFDLNLGADYKFNDNISAFLDLNNILNQKYQRLNGYQAYGFNLIGGVMFKFK
ncbi:MAG: hypothetical protein RI894_1544 [Bacteroidota bacterium]